MTSRISPKDDPRAQLEAIGKRLSELQRSNTALADALYQKEDELKGERRGLHNSQLALEAREASTTSLSAAVIELDERCRSVASANEELNTTLTGVVQERRKVEDLLQDTRKKEDDLSLDINDSRLLAMTDEAAVCELRARYIELGKEKASLRKQHGEVDTALKSLSCNIGALSTHDLLLARCTAPLKSP